LHGFFCGLCFYDCFKIQKGLLFANIKGNDKSKIVEFQSLEDRQLVRLPTTRTTLVNLNIVAPDSDEFLEFYTEKIQVQPYFSPHIS
jgi:hypothetical protein